MMKSHRILELISRAKTELDKVALEVALDSDGTGTLDSDLVDVRARVDALEARVTVIEERGEL